jgi:hypothetical protein
MFAMVLSLLGGRAAHFLEPSSQAIFVRNLSQTCSLFLLELKTGS